MKRLNTNPDIITRLLKQNKFFPNSKLPLLIYKTALNLPDQKNKAADIVQKTFLRNNWGNTWRNGIYTFHHYHSNTHECLGISSGEARVIFGGPGRKSITVNAGDVIIIPAGVAHMCVESSENFECIGAYPQAKNYDIYRGESEEEFGKSQLRISKVTLPQLDPVFGKEGFLKSYWRQE